MLAWAIQKLTKDHQVTNAIKHLLSYLTYFLVIALVGLPGFASAQTNPSRMAAGAAGISVIQQNKIRQELHDTKQELKAIREGLGIQEEDHRRAIAIDPHEKILIYAIPLALILAASFGLAGYILYRFIFRDERSRLEKSRIVLVEVASWALAIAIPFPLFLVPLLSGVEPGTDAEPYMALGGLCSAGLVFVFYRLRRKVLRCRAAEQSDRRPCVLRSR
jgi:hypothetical protein